MTTTDHLTLLLGECEKRDLSSELLDDSVNTTTKRVLERAGEFTGPALDEEATWAAEKINEEGLEAQLKYLLENHDYRWVHELLTEL